jgi:hypothetical protein
MTDLQFDNTENEFGRPPVASAGFDITGKLVGWGLVSTRQQAEYVLIGLGVLVLIIAFFVYHGTGSSLPPPPPVGV